LMGHSNSTDRDWQKWGERNPYFGVLSESKYLDANLNDDSLSEFFLTGERHVDHVLGVIRSSISPVFDPVRVLDYGCGVGRLVVPFAAQAQQVVGIDVAPGMLEQARENCRKHGIDSASFLLPDQMDSLDPGSFDLVHSFIVFQHIPVARGELIVRKLIALLAEGGVGAFHFTYADTRTPIWRFIKAVRKRIGLVHGLLNLLQGQRASTPPMQMNNYSIHRIFDILIVDILIDEHCSNVHVEFSEHGAMRGAMIYFEKAPHPLL
jgi:SAM-dependent methyltransferase